MIHVLKFTLTLLIALSFGDDVFGQQTTREKTLPNFYKINKNLYRGGQPKDVGFKRLKEEFNIKTIIYLRSRDDKAENERKLAEDAGMKLINIPLSNWFAPKKFQIDNVLAEINDPENQPVFVHCKRGADRTNHQEVS